MAKILSHQQDYERFFQPFIKLALTEHWKEALNILYCNGDVLDFEEGIKTPVLISRDGSDEDLNYKEECDKILEDMDYFKKKEILKKYD